MLETVDLEASLKKKDYKDAQDRLDPELARLQRELRQARVPTIIVFEGWDAAGKGVVLSRLLQPFDPRGFKVSHIAPPTDEEQMRPAMWRFWLTLPADGTIGIFFLNYDEKRPHTFTWTANLAEAGMGEPLSLQLSRWTLQKGLLHPVPGWSMLARIALQEPHVERIRFVLVGLRGFFLFVRLLCRRRFGPGFLRRGHLGTGLAGSFLVRRLARIRLARLDNVELAFL